MSETHSPVGVITIQRLLPFASWARMGTIGQEQSVVAAESGRSTSELTGTQRQGAARHMLPGTACGAMPLRVRVERPVRSHRTEPRVPCVPARSATRGSSLRRFGSQLVACIGEASGNGRA